MLIVEALFPFSGSRAFLAPDAAPVRIQRVNLDNTAFITRLPGAGAPYRDARQLAAIASGNTTVPLDQLHETAEAALAPQRKARTPRRAPRRSAK